MFAEKLTRTRVWLILCSYGIAAVLCLLQGLALTKGPYWAQAAGIATFVGLTASIRPHVSLNRTIGQIYSDFRMGRQAPLTGFEKASSIVGMALVIITTIQMSHG